MLIHRINKEIQDYNLEALELENKFQEDQIQIYLKVHKELLVEIDFHRV